MRFSFDPNADPKAEMTGVERIASSAPLPTIFLWLHGLADNAADGIGGGALHPLRGVGVGAEGKARVVVSQRTGQRLDVHAVLEGQRGEGVPLRYNYDKPEKPRISRGFRLSGKVFHPFPNRKIEPRSSYIVGGVIVTTKTKYCLGGLSARPRNQDISSEKKKCPFFVPKIRCRQEEHDD